MSLEVKDPTPGPTRMRVKAAVKEIADAADGKWRVVQSYKAASPAYATARRLRAHGCEATVRKVEGPQWEVYGRIP